MSEQRSRETPEKPAPPPPSDDAGREERPRPQEDFKGYSLELLAVLEG